MKLLKLFFLLGVVLMPIIGRSCDCVSMIGLKEAKSIFKGKILSIERVEQPYIFYKVEFEVYKYIKKEKRKCKKVITVSIPSLQEGGCGIPFKVGDRYKVFTYLEDKMLYTSICTETKKIE